MARFSEYLDAEYLPGEVYSAGLSDYRSRPQEIIDYLADKKFKFQPENDGSYFQQFLALQNNPEALLASKLNLPKRFQEFMTMSGVGT